MPKLAVKKKAHVVEVFKKVPFARNKGDLEVDGRQPYPKVGELWEVGFPMGVWRSLLPDDALQALGKLGTPNVRIRGARRTKKSGELVTLALRIVEVGSVGQEGICFVGRYNLTQVRRRRCDVTLATGILYLPYGESLPYIRQLSDPARKAEAQTGAMYATELTPAEQKVRPPLIPVNRREQPDGSEAATTELAGYVHATHLKARLADAEAWLAKNGAPSSTDPLNGSWGRGNGFGEMHNLVQAEVLLSRENHVPRRDGICRGDGEHSSRIAAGVFHAFFSAPQSFARGLGLALGALKAQTSDVLDVLDGRMLSQLGTDKLAVPGWRLMQVADKLHMLGLYARMLSQTLYGLCTLGGRHTRHERSREDRVARIEAALLGDVAHVRRTLAAYGKKRAIGFSEFGARMFEVPLLRAAVQYLGVKEGLAWISRNARLLADTAAQAGTRGLFDDEDSHIEG